MDINLIIYSFYLFKKLTMWFVIIVSLFYCICMFSKKEIIHFLTTHLIFEENVLIYILIQTTWQ